MFKLPKKVTGDVPAQYAVTDTKQGTRIAAASSTPGKSLDPSGVQQVEYQATNVSTTQVK